MLLSSLESLATLLFTLFVFFRAGLFRAFGLIGSNPIILFCLIFGVAFSFAVGISTYNFGSLVRYKIPMLPFYLSGLIILWYHVNEARKTKQVQGRPQESVPY